MNILKSGDKFTAKTKAGESRKYKFLGLDLGDMGEVDGSGSGCRYIVLRNLDDGTCTCVERTWFSRSLTGRKIEREER